MKIYKEKSNDLNKTYTLKQQWGDEENINVCLNLTHDDNNLIINFDVFENELRRETSSNNSKVYEDSCVEIFLQNINSKKYLNFEISASSYMLIGKGENRNNRKKFDNNIIDTIKRKVIIYCDKKNNVHWSLKIYLDLYKWDLVEKKDISKQKIKANFYKCGDKLKTPHYLTLFNVDTKEPNFHNPTSFQELLFV